MGIYLILFAVVWKLSVPIESEGSLNSESFDSKPEKQEFLSKISFSAHEPANSDTDELYSVRSVSVA